MDKVENKANAVAENVSNQLSKVTSFSFKDFLSSNSLVSKIAFTLLVMFVFFLLLKFSITLIPVLFKENSSPYIFNGTIEGNNSIVIPQDPEYDNAITIKRSLDENGGIEFSWSLWLFLDDSVLKSGSSRYLQIFHKGDDKKDASTELYNIASPGLYLNENQNQLLVTMNTYNNSDTLMDQIVVNDIPMNKWFNIIIRVKNKRLDVYINGTIKRAFELEGVPKQNYGDIFVAQGSNLQSSKLSNLRYYDYALNVSDIQKMVKKGANKTLITKNAMSDSSSSYLAFDWYYN